MHPDVLRRPAHAQVVGPRRPRHHFRRAELVGRTSTSTPSRETQGPTADEGPEALRHDGRTFLVDSANARGTPSTGPIGWRRPAAPHRTATSGRGTRHRSSGNDAAGGHSPGHNGFSTSPDGTENRVVHHADDTAIGRCDNGRTTRAPQFPPERRRHSEPRQPGRSRQHPDEPLRGYNDHHSRVHPGEPRQRQVPVGVGSQQRRRCESPSADLRRRRPSTVAGQGPGLPTKAAGAGPRPPPGRHPDHTAAPSYLGVTGPRPHPRRPRSSAAAIHELRHAAPEGQRLPKPSGPAGPGHHPSFRET
ncbi:family 43 glycosylhydrolase [Streptomyces spongiae]|uniref:Family 43 glycosylhydrolase n=1 Tax=Streptomyces spongiae TaxID=565072 RepID=A0A5N8XME4_9ACTN|nr:family 43 glycosylhydrolase [Streptomyces spongiae]